MLLRKDMRASEFARQLRALVKQKLTGDFKLRTLNNGYWIRLWYGSVVDCPPVLRDKGFLRKRLDYVVTSLAEGEKYVELDFVLPRT